MMPLGYGRHYMRKIHKNIQKLFVVQCLSKKLDFLGFSYKMPIDILKTLPHKECSLDENKTEKPFSPTLPVYIPKYLGIFQSI